MAADTMVMLDLLEEAGEEPVTLDELGVAGVRDPARALLELELAGLEIQRVLVRADREDVAHECIRLARPAAAAPQAADEQPTVELAAVAPRTPPAPPEPEVSPEPTPGAPLRRLVFVGLLLALLALALRRS
jgi:hypothetical protein